MRVVSGVAVVALVGAVATGADALDLGHREVQPVAPVVATSAPLSAGLVCPGPAQLADPDSTQDPDFDPTPVDTVAGVGVLVSRPSTPEGDPVRGLDGESYGPLRTGTDAAVGQLGVEGPVSVWARPDEDGELHAAAVASSSTAEGDLRGLAAASCAVPSVEQWLVGGTTEVGTSTRLVLQNSAQTPASVRIDVWGGGGALDLQGPAVFTVPAGGQTTTLLEGLAPEERRLAVRVTSSGALISSYLQVNSLDGLTPVGVDFVAPADAPAARQVLSGLWVPASEVGDETGPVLRLLAPEAEQVTAEVTVLGPSGRVLLPGAEQVTVDGVTDVSLAGLPAGQYTVVVDADAPVVASAEITRSANFPDSSADGERDVAVTPGRVLAEADGDRGAVAVPADVRGQVLLAAVPADVRAVPGALPGEASDDADDGDADGAAGNDDGAAGDAESDSDVIEDATPTSVEVTVVGADGTVVGTQRLDLEPGRTVAVDPWELADGDVAGVRVSAGSGDPVAWSFVATAGADQDMVAVLAPVPVRQTRVEVALRAGQATGLSRVGAETASEG
ncbi:MAG: DUF5719 family protein [Cellulomonadaceae bacterium]